MEPKIAIRPLHARAALRASDFPAQAGPGVAGSDVTRLNLSSLFFIFPLSLSPFLTKEKKKEKEERGNDIPLSRTRLASQRFRWPRRVSFAKSRAT
jgi:hypothetical protein